MLKFSISFLKSHFHNQVTYFFVGIYHDCWVPHPKLEKKEEKKKKPNIKIKGFFNWNRKLHQ